MTVTWDGVLLSQQRRRERAALRLPGFPLGVVSFRDVRCGTAAGAWLIPTRTGSHHKQREES